MARNKIISIYNNLKHLNLSPPKDHLIKMASLTRPVSAEDAFYDNITLGLPQLLETIPRVRNIMLEKRPPCERLLLNSWEQRHCCSLPEDMRQFYSSTDGLKLTWSYEYSPQDIREVGKVHIRSLGELAQMAALKDEMEQNHQNVTQNGGGPNIGAKSKIIELDNVDNLAKVCMVFEEADRNPRFWLLDPLDVTVSNTSTSQSQQHVGDTGNNSYSRQWIPLANSFTQYLRMSIVHLGLPQWQLCFSTQGMMPWAEQLFMLIAPHLLHHHQHHHHGGDSTLANSSSTTQQQSEPPENTLDEAVFKPTVKTRGVTGGAGGGGTLKQTGYRNN